MHLKEPSLTVGLMPRPRNTLLGHDPGLNCLDLTLVEA